MCLDAHHCCENGTPLIALPSEAQLISCNLVGMDLLLLCPVLDRLVTIHKKAEAGVELFHNSLGAKAASPWVSQ